MKKKSKLSDSIVTFEHPLQIENTLIYGAVYNKSICSPYDNDNRFIECFVYIMGAIRFVNEGGVITPDGNYWTDPKTQQRHYYKSEFVKNYSKNSLADKLIFYVYESDTPLKYNKHEVDDGFIIDQSLIKRYVQGGRRFEYEIHC